uniref:CSON006635 protein n=1 Tax=Culicoides sonorensis TaxID=179676 RepID=A0A336LWS0_CULSO
MKITFILELLLILVLIAYAAQARIINGNDARKISRRPPLRQTATNTGSASGSVEDIDSLVVVEPDLYDESALEDASTIIADSASVEATTVENTDDQSTINRYCKCTSYECNCCREFRLPIAGIGSNGCATVNYLDGERMSVGLKFGDRLVASRVISSRRPTPICLPLPGGFSRFCGRIYGISRRNDDFQACLGLELRADDEVEAALRVSCFKFGPRGLQMTEAQPLPPAVVDSDEDDDESDEETDDDADYGLIDPAAEFDEPVAAKKQPARDVLSKTSNATQVALNETKVETTTKKNKDDDDDSDEDEDEDVFDIVETIVGSQASDDDDDENELEGDESEEDENDEKDASSTTKATPSKKKDPSKKKREDEPTSIFTKLYRYLAARKK